MVRGRNEEEPGARGSTRCPTVVIIRVEEQPPQ